MHGNGDDEEAERRRQALENQNLPFDDLVYGKKRTTKTGEEDRRHGARALRLKAMPLRVRLDVNAALMAAMKAAGYTALPAFFEHMFAVYLRENPLDEETLKRMPVVTELQQRFLARRDEDDGQ